MARWTDEQVEWMRRRVRKAHDAVVEQREAEAGPEAAWAAEVADVLDILEYADDYGLGDIDEVWESRRERKEQRGN